MHAAEYQHGPSRPFADTAGDPVVCHCLGVTEMEIRGAVSTGAVEHLKCVMDCTGAGTGCTACHLRIRELLRERYSARERSMQAELAVQTHPL